MPTGVPTVYCSKCLTKLYCGDQCRDEDWEKVHRKVCKKGEDRKVKGGYQERKKKGENTFDLFEKVMNEYRDM